jgi:nicotinate phosphoribosyltransferase
MTSSHPRLAIPSLVVDLYELTMLESYLREEMNQEATFSLFARRLPADHGFFIAAGLDSVLQYLTDLQFTEPDLAYLESTRLFSQRVLDWLRSFHFSGSVRAMPEGTVCFPDEPLVEVTAPIQEAQIVESAIVNLVHFQTIIASKAARCVLAADGRQLVEFGLRRIHGVDAAAKVARSCYLAGFASTSNVHAGQLYGIPVAGTMAHSYIQSIGDELEAFRAFARAYPDACVLLIDTYDTIEGARRAAVVGRELALSGHRLRGVRLDSGDLLELSRGVRSVLDDADLIDSIIFASGGLDELEIQRLLSDKAPIDAFGVGTKLGVAADAPYLDMAYKLVQYGEQPTMKLSSGKVTWPGPKQVWRFREQGAFAWDVLSLANTEQAGGEPLLRLAMERGMRLDPVDTLSDIRERCRSELAALPAGYRALERPEAYPVRPDSELLRLRDHLIRGYQGAAGS